MLKSKILNQVQDLVHDKTVWFWCCCHPGPCPELDSGLVRDLGFEFWVLKPRPVGGVLYRQCSLLEKGWHL